MALYEWFSESLVLFCLIQIDIKHCKSSRRAHDALMSSTDRSVPRRFRSSVHMTNDSPVHSKPGGSNEIPLCAARRRTVLTKTDTVLTSYWLNCCVRSVSLLHSCDIALSSLLVCYAYDVNMRQKLSYLEFQGHSSYVLWAPSRICHQSAVRSVTHTGLGRGKCVKCVLVFIVINWSS